MSGAIAGLVKNVLPQLEGGAGIGTKDGDLAQSFTSMLGGGSSEGSAGAAKGGPAAHLQTLLGAGPGAAMVGSELVSGGAREGSGAMLSKGAGAAMLGSVLGGGSQKPVNGGDSVNDDGADMTSHGNTEGPANARMNGMTAV